MGGAPTLFLWPQQLPPEILMTILIKLHSLIDFIRAGAVCTPRRSAVAEIVSSKLQPPSHKLPWLIFIKTPCIFPQETKLVNLFHANKKVYNLTFSKVYQAYLLGSLGEWLILVDLYSGVFLLNVFTEEKTFLPRHAKVWNGQQYSHIKKFWMDSSLRSDISITAALSSVPTSGDCMVAINCRQCTTLAFCKLGDEAWIGLERSSGRQSLSDMAFSNDGRVLFTCSARGVAIYELGPHPKSTSRIIHPQLEIDYWDGGVLLVYVRGHYLVESCGELLLVLKLLVCPNRSRERFFAFKIFKMDAGRSHWIKVESLGDQILFLGYYGCSMSVSAKGIPGLKGNCIYFTWMTGHVSMFNLEDGSMSTDFVPKIPYSCRSIPTWVTPSLT